jgi:hypothetical protein
MAPIDKRELSALYAGSDINLLWKSSQSLQVINHPTFGKISPNQYRSRFHNKPCPFCAQKMVHGYKHIVSLKDDAIARGYEYEDHHGKSVIHRAGGAYFHPHYVTLDHRLNKARCPEHIFEYDNLQIMCWKCNRKKGDDNAFNLQHSFEYLNDLVTETLNQYPLL